MDAFEVFLQKFNSTIYGSEMRYALYRCFELIRVEIKYCTNTIQEANSKIEKLEGGE